jgi:hypothetical protein
VPGRDGSNVPGHHEPAIPVPDLQSRFRSGFLSGSRFFDSTPKPMRGNKKLVAPRPTHGALTSMREPARRERPSRGLRSTCRVEPSTALSARASTVRSVRLDSGRRRTVGFLTLEQWSATLEAAQFADVRAMPDVARIRDVFPTLYEAAIGASRLACAARPEYSDHAGCPAVKGPGGHPAEPR